MATPQLYSTLGWGSYRPTGGLLSSCSCLPGYLSDSCKAAGHPGAEEDSRGPVSAQAEPGVPQGRSLLPQGQNLSVFQSSASSLMKEAVGPSGRSGKGREIHVFGQSSIR